MLVIKLICCVCAHQELVNLLLCGRAVSNVFDNDIELDSGNGNMTLLKGVKDPCDIGLLSLFEHYNICKVSDSDSRLFGSPATNRPDTSQIQVKTQDLKGDSLL